MKNFTLGSLLLITVLCLSLTSCLGDSNTTSTYELIPGVVKIIPGSYKTVVETTYTGTVYSPQLDSKGYMGGECVLITFTYDSGDPQNEDAVVKANGYYTVTLLADPYNVPKGNVAYQQGDTTTLQANEIPLDYGIARYEYQYLTYINGNMFLTSGLNELTNQKNRWTLYFDPEQTPAKDSSTGRNVYSGFLRAIVTTKGDTPAKNMLEMNTYYMKTVIDEINNREKTAGNKEYYLKVNFINQIKADSTFKWAAADQIMFAVPEE